MNTTSKEVLPITNAMVNDGFAEPMSFDIVTAFNETYGKGYNPAAMDEVVFHLEQCIEYLDKHSLSLDLSVVGVLSQAKTALQNSKL